MVQKLQTFYKWSTRNYASEKLFSSAWSHSVLLFWLYLLSSSHLKATCCTLKKYVLFVLRKPFDKFYTFLESWFSDSGLHSHFSLLTVKPDWWLAEMRKMGEGKENFIKFHDVWDWFCGHWTVCLRQGWRELIVFSIDTWQCLALERKGGPQLYFS